MLLRCRNYYGARYPTTDYHNCICFHGVGPFPHFHGVGTSHLLFQESLRYLIPNNGSAQSSMLPWYRTFSHFHGVGTSPHFHEVGINMVHNTQQRISTIFYASTAQDPFHTSMAQELLHASTGQESLWCSISYNGLAPSSTLPRYRTLSTLPQCKNFSSLVRGIIMVVDIQKQISIIVHASTTQDPPHISTVQELLHASTAL